MAFWWVCCVQAPNASAAPTNTTTTPAKLQAQHGVLLLLLLTLAETGRGRCKYVWCAWVLPLQSFTHSPHQITLPTRLTHDTVPTRSKPRARRTTLLPSCPCFGTARTSARLVSAPTPTPTPSRQPQPPLAHHAGAGLAMPNATRPDRPSSSGPLARHHLLAVLPTRSSKQPIYPVGLFEPGCLTPAVLTSPVAARKDGGGWRRGLTRCALLPPA